MIVIVCYKHTQTLDNGGKSGETTKANDGRAYVSFGSRLRAISGVTSRRQTAPAGDRVGGLCTLFCAVMTSRVRVPTVRVIYIERCSVVAVRAFFLVVDAEFWRETTVDAAQSQNRLNF